MKALIPARAGSKRLPGKNTRLLGDKPLIHWTIDAAREVFGSEVYVCSDIPAQELQCGTTKLIPRDPVPDDQSDIEWITKVLEQLNAKPDDEFCLLRPTSPFRGPTTIRRALEQWEEYKRCVDSVRAVREATEPAWKQWVRYERSGGLVLMVPAVMHREDQHLHSRPTQMLPKTYIQTAGLEIFWTRTIFSGSLSGKRVGMFLTEGAEALDLNTPEDWSRAEEVVFEGPVGGNRPLEDALGLLQDSSTCRYSPLHDGRTLPRRQS